MATAAAEEACGLCDKEIVTNSDLATCFLAKYQELRRAAATARSWSISPNANVARRGRAARPAPSADERARHLQFMVSRAQLDCLKQKLEEPGLVLDPSAKIDLESCG